MTDATPTLSPAVVTEEIQNLRQREFQMMGAAISRRNWHELEAAYNAGRDRLDRNIIIPLIRLASLASPERPVERIAQAWTDDVCDAVCDVENGKTIRSFRGLWEKSRVAAILSELSGRSGV